ncbi:MAG: integrase, partial [Polyangia bacterium]|nr:integrase [Polyangia bacterium]
RHLHLVLSEMIKWYCGGRVHQGIQGIPDPDPSLAEPKPAVEDGHLVAHPILGGLHHDYRLVA